MPPVISLDTAGEVVLNFADRATETFDNTGTHFVYSVTEKVQGTPAKLRASVNWWLDPATADGQRSGERVSGPMTVFDGALYFATYAAVAARIAVVQQRRRARSWGRDFVRPDDPNDALQRRDAPPAAAAGAGAHESAPRRSSRATTTRPSSARSFPGSRSRRRRPAPSLGRPVPTRTSQGPSIVAADFAGGQYSLFTQIGTKGTGGTTRAPSTARFPTPVAPTMIDSWAAVVE